MADTPKSPARASKMTNSLLRILVLATFIGAAGISAGLVRHGMRDQANASYLLAGLVGVVDSLASVPGLVLAWMRLNKPERLGLTSVDLAMLRQAIDRVSEQAALSDDARR